MNKFFRQLLLCQILFAQTIVSAEYFPAQGQNPSYANQRISSHDAIILNEDNIINISGRKAAFIEFTVSKKMRIRILSQIGLERFSNYLLPETFDPTYISHFPPDRNYTYTFSNIKFNNFSGSITTKDGTKKEASIKSQIIQLKMIENYEDHYGDFEKKSYHIGNLNIGDILEVEYSYNMRYPDNISQLSSFRVFFNGDVQKENYSLTLSHFTDLNMDIEFSNAAEPDSAYEADEQKIYVWNKKNLPGCINEPGSRPYHSLPYVIFSVKPYELLYTIPYSFEERYIPFYALFSFQREKNHLGIAKSVQQGTHTKQYTQIDKFLANQTSNILDDSLGYAKLLKVHHTIVDEFSFDNDTNYFKRIDTRDARMGDYLTKKTLRDISRYDVYVALLLKMNLTYFTTYLCDSRSGELNDVFFGPMYDSDYLLTVLLKNNSIQYIYPKKAQFGYYLNELPFYYEDTKARLVHLNDYRNIKQAMSESQREIKLPNSTMADNIRRNSILVEINLDSLSAHFTSKIHLSGQYSTLIRGLYLNNYQDESVNPLYNKKIWEMNDQVEVVNQETTVEKKEFPFSTTVKAEYICNDLIEVKEDTMTLNLTDWFNHIIYPNFDTTGRQLDFYPDFRGIDSYVYYIQFNKDVRLIESIKNIKINNAFGELIINVVQANPNTIKLSSSFKTISDSVDVHHMAAVQEIFDNLQRLNQGNLFFVED